MRRCVTSYVCLRPPATAISKDDSSTGDQEIRSGTIASTDAYRSMAFFEALAASQICVPCHDAHALLTPGTERHSALVSSMLCNPSKPTSTENKHKNAQNIFHNAVCGSYLHEVPTERRNRYGSCIPCLLAGPRDPNYSYCTPGHFHVIDTYVIIDYLVLFGGRTAGSPADATNQAIE